MRKVTKLKNWWRLKTFLGNFITRKSAEFQNKFQERLKAKSKHSRIKKSGPTRNHLTPSFAQFLRKILKFYKKFEEQSKN